MNTFIPAGVSLHGLKLLHNHDFKVSLYDLKKYDNAGKNKEITLLKNKANKIPRNKHSDKILAVEDFINWELYKYNTVMSWGNKPVDVLKIWKYLEDEIVESSSDKEAIMFFSINQKILFHFGILLFDRGSIQTVLEHQMNMLPTYVHAELPWLDNVVFGWVNYSIDENIVIINEVQSELEDTSSKSLKISNLKTLTAMCLTEFIRNFYNKGFRRFELNNNKIIHSDVPIKFPREIYSKMFTNLGFEYNEDRSKLLFDLEQVVL